MLHRFVLSPHRLPTLLLFGCALALGAHPAAAQFPPTVDGTIPNGSNNSDEYVTAAPRASGVGDDTAPEAERILFYADDANQTLYVGVRGALPTGSDDGIALWLNFRELNGADAGTDLGGVSGAGHYLSSSPMRADFEVDYMLALHTNGTNSEVQVEAVKHVGSATSQDLGTTPDQTGGTTTTAFFSSGVDITFAFNNNGTGDNKGFEIAIPYGALGVSRAGAMEAFAGVVGPTGSFTEETVPGNLSSAPGTSPDFGALSGGPFHRTKTFTARFTTGTFTVDPSDGSFTKNNTWEGTETDGETIPFQGSKVVAGQVNANQNRNSYVVFDTDVTLHTFTVDTGTDGDASNFSDVQSAVTIADSLILDSEDLTANGGSLSLASGATLERSNGTIGFAPTFSGTATVAYTAGLTTGPELPSTISSMQVAASSSTVTLGRDVTVSNTLDLDAGTLSDNGGSQTLTLSNGSTVRRGNGALGFTPSFGTTVNVTYTAGLTTGPELPGTVGSLVVDATGSTVTLGRDVTASNTLDLNAGTLSDDGGSHVLTLADGSSVRRSAGAVGFTPSFGGTVDVTYTASLTTGLELPSSGTGTLTVDASPATVTVADGTNPTVSNALTVTSGTLDLNGNDVSLTGDLTENGTLVDNASTGGTVTFDAGGTQTVTGDPAFASVTLNTTADFGSSPTVEGTLTLNPGGSVTTSAPNYSGNATLRYETGTTTNRGVEWNSTNGAGYPTDVTLANGTTLDLSAGGTATARSIAGALTIGGSSTLDMDDMSAALTVGNGATVNGALTLGSAAGGDLIVSGGDLTVDGTLTANGRTVTLSGSSAQTLGGTVSSLSLGGLTVDNANGVTLGTEITLSKLLTLTSGTLTSNGNLTLQSTASGTAAVAGSGNGTVSGDVTMERYVGFPDDASNNSHWRFLASPLSVMLDDAGTAGNSDNLLSNVWTQATGSGANAQVSAGNATIFTYAEDTNVSSGLAEGWTDVADLNASSITPGDGYLTFLFENNRSAGPDGFPVTLSVTGSLPANETNGSNAAPTLTFTDDDDSNAQNGWNLMANPFAAPLDWESVVNNGLDQLDKTIYVWDPSAGQYATYTADGGGTGGAGTQDQYIAPFQVFFVKAEPLSIKLPDPPTKSSSLAPGMTILADDKAVGVNPSLKSTPSNSSVPRITLRLRTAANNTSETTVVRYTDEAYAGKDRLDAYQLKPFRSDYALLASGMDGRDALFDLQSRPVPSVRDTIDLALDVTASGTYTLDASALQALPSGWKVILENVDSGARHDLGAGASVTFDHTAPTSNPSSATASSLQAGAPTVAKATDGSGDLPDFRLYVGPQAALPVELASFDASADTRAVSLTWQTASETNNAGFAVERRIEGSGSWMEVGTRAGAGTTTRPRTYRFRDADVPFGAESMTYRLRQTDLDGRTTVSDTLAVSLAAPETTTLRPPFPNPVQHRATVRYTLPRAQSVTIALYDVLGRRMRTLAQGRRASGRYEQAVDLSGLSSGAYFVRMRAGNTTHTQRLTVMR